MRCSSCGRHITKTDLELAGAKFGPVCAQKVLVAAGQIEPRQQNQRIHESNTAVVRDERTRDLFEGVSA